MLYDCSAELSGHPLLRHFKFAPVAGPRAASDCHCKVSLCLAGLTLSDDKMLKILDSFTGEELLTLNGGVCLIFFS